MTSPIGGGEAPAALASRPLLDDATSPAAIFIDLQRRQWEAFFAWQRSLAALGRDLWEQWAVRFSGGVPLDG